jgi:hypothetical protein
LAHALAEGLKNGLAAPPAILTHVTPELISAQLPKELTTQIVAKALGAGRLTPDLILEVASPVLLAEHVDPQALWKCVQDLAKAAKLDQKGRQASEPARRWLGDVLRMALDLGLMDERDVVRFLPPTEWVKDAPLPVLAEMLKAGLGRGRFDAEIALQHLTPKVIAEHLPTALTWSCIAECVGKEIGMKPVEDLPLPFEDGDVFIDESSSVHRA